MGRNQRGFTLIEVLIVVIIMAVLGSLSAVSIQNSSRMKVKLQKGVDQISGAKSALSVIERDFNLSFHYRDINYEIESGIEQSKAKDLAARGIPYEAKPVEPPPQVTGFEGTANSIAFTSLAHVRTVPDAQESEQIEVKYYLKSCKSYRNAEMKGQCLFRSIATTLDGDFETTGEETAIIEGVTQLEFRFYGEGKQDWVQLWKTGEGADDVTKDRFPQAVEITLETEEDQKKLKLVTVAEIRMPNNKPLPKELGGTSR